MPALFMFFVFMSFLCVYVVRRRMGLLHIFMLLQLGKRCHCHGLVMARICTWIFSCRWVHGLCSKLAIQYLGIGRQTVLIQAAPA